jgi:integrase
MASVQKVRNGYRVVVSRTEGGQRHRLVRVVPTRAAANAVVRELADERGPNPYVRDLLKEYMEAPHTWTPATRAAYARRVQDYLLPAFGGYRVLELTPEVIERTFGKWAETLAPNTCRALYALLSGVLRQALRWGRISRNPLDRVEPPRVRENPITVPTTERIRAWLEKADPWLRSAALLAASTGMRRGELCALRWSDLEGDRVTIRRSVGRVRGELLVGETKTHASRTLVLSRWGSKAVEELRTLQAKRAAEAGVELVDDPWLLSLAPDGGVPMSGDALSHRWQALTEGQCRWHDLRHWAGTQMAAQGVPVRAIMARLGHTALATTQRYAHAEMSADRIAARALDAALGRESAPSEEGAREGLG